MFKNPINGIESYHPMPHQDGATHQNPINGIESLAYWLRGLRMLLLFRNPINGIESIKVDVAWLSDLIRIQ